MVTEQYSSTTDFLKPQADLTEIDRQAVVQGSIRLPQFAKIPETTSKFNVK